MLHAILVQVEGLQHRCSVDYLEIDCHIPITSRLRSIVGVVDSVFHSHHVNLFIITNSCQTVSYIPDGFKNDALSAQVH